MPSRSKNNQSKHDKKVESLAENLEKQGFSVQADISGYDKPTTFGGMRPDVIGRKGKERRIYEVETPDSVDSARDQKQQEEFKDVADMNPVKPVGQEAPAQTIEKPTSVTVFGVMNIVLGCYILARLIHSWYRIIPGIVKNPENMITWTGILILLLGIVGVGLAIWLIVLGAGLLKMKRWARRGSVIYGWIQVVFIVITLGSIFISSITDWENAPRILWASINIGNALAVIEWIYMVLLLVFMKTKRVKQAFEAIGG